MQSNQSPVYLSNPAVICGIAIKRLTEAKPNRAAKKIIFATTERLWQQYILLGHFLSLLILPISKRKYEICLEWQHTILFPFSAIMGFQSKVSVVKFRIFVYLLCYWPNYLNKMMSLHTSVCSKRDVSIWYFSIDIMFVLFVWLSFARCWCG